MVLVATETAMPAPAVNQVAMVVPPVGELAHVEARFEPTRFEITGDSGLQFLPIFTFMRIKNIKKISNKKSKNKYPLVKVIWRDSNIYRFQDSIQYALENYSIEIITTVGFLIGYQNRNPMIVRDLLNKNIDQRCSIVIPKENIVSFVKITNHKIDKDDSGWLVKTESKPQ
ncbi:MAG: hypothetical protein RL536_510 [Candidatus Parcubacteria bacterium]|jgi:hypothetical protein